MSLIHQTPSPTASAPGQGRTTPMSQSQSQPIKKRRDRLGNVINQGVNKRWQVTFRDMITKGETLSTVYEVENYKEYNKIDDDPYKENWETQYKYMKMKSLEEENNEHCSCSIF